MRIFKRGTAFLCLNILAVMVLKFVLTTPVQYPILYRQCKEGDYNNIIVGHSYGYRGLDPAQLHIDEDDCVFNICIPGSPLSNVYYQVRDLNEAHSLKRVYFDLCWQYWTKSTYSANVSDYNAQLMQMMSWGGRQEFFRKELLHENYNKVLFPYTLDNRAVQNLKDLPYVIRTKLDPRYLKGSPEMLEVMNDPQLVQYKGDGFFSARQHITQPDDGYAFWQFDESIIAEEAIADFDKLVNYCKEQGIELYCIETAVLPIRLRTENHDAAHDYFAKLCRDREVDYFDMNYVKFELLPRTYEDYQDMDGHMTGQTAARQTRLIREIISSGDPDSYFEDSYEDVLAGIEDWESSQA